MLGEIIALETNYKRSMKQQWVFKPLGRTPRSNKTAPLLCHKSPRDCKIGIGAVVDSRRDIREVPGRTLDKHRAIATHLNDSCLVEHIDSGTATPVGCFINYNI